MADALLSLDAVSKSYWRGAHRVRVLTGASLDVHAGEFVAVWGKRGAGKTTLLKIAAGLESAGRRHRPLRRASDLARLSECAHARLMREQVGWVRRAGPRSELRMLDYVALPLLIEHGQRRARRRRQRRAARVGMSECAGQRWDSLSDGERALVAIAHGIVRAPAAAARRRSHREPRRARARGGHRAAALAGRGDGSGRADDRPGHAGGDGLRIRSGR